MAEITGFFVRLFNNSLDHRKPFNPIWGETVQYTCRGFTFDLEQSMHHPPVISFYVANKDKSFE